VIKEQWDGDILRTYETERRPVAEQLLEADRTVLALFGAQLGSESVSLLEKAAGLRMFLSGRDICYNDPLLTLQPTKALGSLVPGECLPDISVSNYATGRSRSIHSLLKVDGSWGLILWAGDVSRSAGMERVHSLAGRIGSIRDEIFSAVSARLDPYLIHCSEWPAVELSDFPRLFFPPDEITGRDYEKILVDEMSVYEDIGISRIEGGISIVRPDRYIGWCGSLADLEGLERYLYRIFRRGFKC
jgi:phenol 2-monooxygenase